MTNTCRCCLTPCPEHGNKFCHICHKHEGECSRGGCTRKATGPRFSLVRVSNGSTVERGRICRSKACRTIIGYRQDTTGSNPVKLVWHGRKTK